MVGAEGVAGDFAVADGDKNKKKGGERRCHLEEVGLAGEVVGVEDLAEVGVEDLAEVGVEVGLAGVVVGAGALAGVGLGMACPTVILMGDTDLATHIMVMVHHHPMATSHGKSV